MYIRTDWLTVKQHQLHICVAESERDFSMKKKNKTGIHTNLDTHLIKQTHTILLYWMSCPYVFITMKFNSILFCFRSINIREVKKRNNNNNNTKLLEWMNEHEHTTEYNTCSLWLWLLFYPSVIQLTVETKKKKKSWLCFFPLLLLICPKSKCNTREIKKNNDDNDVFVMVNDFFFFSFSRLLVSEIKTLA